ncbi:unnamed protein product, partial [Iphiclides podalirius]
MQRFYFLFCLPLAAAAVNSLKPLTESMGQEVIEMDAPLKELPPDIEEEPSAERDTDVKTVTTVMPTTKVTAVSESRRKMKSSERTHSAQEEDEARIEKELSDLYKDSDYKVDSAEVSKEQIQTTTDSTPVPPATTTDDAEKLIARARDETDLLTSFKFQPDSNRKADVEKFRTSVDVISCNKNRLTGSTPSFTSSGDLLQTSGAVLLISLATTLTSL